MCNNYSGCSGDLTLIASTLQQLLDDGTVSAKDLADASGISSSTIYKWASGVNHPTFHNIMLIFQHCDNQQLQAYLLATLARNTPWVFTYLPPSLDLLGDFEVDTNMVQATILQIVTNLQNQWTLLQDCQKQSANGRIKFTEADHAKLSSSIQECHQAMVNAQQIIDDLLERNNRRKPARPLTVTGRGVLR